MTPLGLLAEMSATVLKVRKFKSYTNDLSNSQKMHYESDRVALWRKDCLPHN